MAYRKIQNIKQLITRTDISWQSYRKPETQEPQGCRNNKCQTCRHYSKTNEITNTLANKRTEIKCRGNCGTTNCIYCIQCTKCNMLYVGQTKNKLSLRLNLHKSDINLNKSFCETTQHFNQTNHSFQDLRITVLDHNDSWTDRERTYREDYYISLLKTRHPTGINRRCGELAARFYKCF